MTIAGTIDLAGGRDVTLLQEGVTLLSRPVTLLRRVTSSWPGQWFRTMADRVVLAVLADTSRLVLTGIVIVTLTVIIVTFFVTVG